MVAKFSARSWLNRIRWARNSASASISLITPAIDVSPPEVSCRAFPAGSTAGAVEFGGQLVEAYRDDIRVFRHPAGGDVLDSAAERYVDTLQLFAMGVPDRLPQLPPQVRGGAFLTGIGEEACHPAHVIPFAPVDQRAGQGYRAPHQLRPEQPGVGVGLQQLRPPVTAALIRIGPPGRGRGPGQDAHPPGGLQQFPGEHDQVLALGGQLARPLLVPGQQAVGHDGRPDGVPQGKIGGRGRIDGPFQLAHVRNLSSAKAYREAVEYGLNFSTCSAGHSVSRYRARSSSRLAAADTPSRASLPAGDSMRSTARRPK